MLTPSSESPLASITPATSTPHGYTPLYQPQDPIHNIIDSATGQYTHTPAPSERETPGEFTPSLTNATNNAFIPREEPDEDPALTRMKGLAAYVTADLKPKNKKEAERIFGKTLSYAADHTTNMYVGRAIASAAGVASNPELLFRNPAFIARGFKLPNAWADRNQLYASIGAQFATMERTKMQQQLIREQAIIKERDKDPKALTKAFLNALTRTAVSPEDRIYLEASGITPEHISKVSAALTLFGQHYTPAVAYKGNRKAEIAESDTAQPADPSEIPSHILTGEAEHGAYGEGLLNQNAAYYAADLFKDDDISRGLFLQIIAMAGANKRNEEDGNTAATAGKNLLNKSIIRLGAAIAEGAAQFARPDSADRAQQDRRNALMHDIRYAYDQGYYERNNELGFSWSRVPVATSDFTAATLGYLHPAGWIAEAIDMYQKGVDEAAANIYNEDPTNMQAGLWERKGVPALKAGTFSAAIIASAGILRGVGKLGQHLMPNIAKRIGGSKTLRYGSRVAEGTTAEALEELVFAASNELYEGVGVIQDRQKKANMDILWRTWTSPEFWAGNVGMNLLFGFTGYRGSRSKAPYRFAIELTSRFGFTNTEAQNVTDRIQSAIEEGSTPQQIQNIIAGEIGTRLTTNPRETRKGMLESALGMFRFWEMEDAAANGVRDAIFKELNISDMRLNENGTYTARIVKRADDGKFEAVEQEMTEDQLNEWLTTEAAAKITNEILNTQALVRGEQTVRAIEKRLSEGKTPFERIAYLLDAPVELQAKLRGKSSFDRETITLFTRYAADEINRLIASGKTPAEARAAEFGTTGATLGAISNLEADFQNRVTSAEQTGELPQGAFAESAAFILPGKTVGDNILMLARGDVDARSVAHDWLEGFARSRYYSDPQTWATRLDALDRELLTRGIIKNSLFGEPEGSRKDIDYIEYLSHLAEQRWLVDAAEYGMTRASTALLADILEDLSAVQNGLAAAQELKTFMESEEGRALLADRGALNNLMQESGASLSDLLAEAEKLEPHTAADFVLKHQQRIKDELQQLADEAETPPPPADTNPAPDTNVELGDGQTVTQHDITAANEINPQNGQLLAAPITSYGSVTAPKGAGKGLVGGVAHRMPDGTIEGTAELSTLKLHPHLATADLTRAQGDSSAPVLIYRRKDGTMEVIGGLARYNHDLRSGNTHTHVKVYNAGKKRPHNWAADFARAQRIRAGISTVADTIRHMAAHKYTRNTARRANLIPKGPDAAELPTSRAAWLLMKHASKKTIGELTAGHITVREALATIADKVDTLDLEQEAQATASFSIRRKFDTETTSASTAEQSNKFDTDGTLHASNAIVTKPGASFSIRAMHASPHSFRKFSTDFMGTGEGAQAFGWGLYFMTNSLVNQHYFERFARDMVKENWYFVYQDYVEKTGHNLLHYRGETEQNFIDALHEELNEAKRQYGLLTEALARLNDKSQSEKAALLELLSRKPKTKIGKALWLKASQAKHLMAEVKKTKTSKAELQDYIKPIKEQLDTVEAFIKRTEQKHPSNYLVELNAEESQLLQWDEYVPKDFVESFISANPDLHPFVQKNLRGGVFGGKISGQEFYYYLSKGFRNVTELEGKKQASMRLLAHGIKGIKFLDGLSRNRGEGTYNYVIFSGDDIKITSVNETGVWDTIDGWQKYNDPTASFSIRAKRRRQYSSGARAYQNELFKALFDEAQRLERETINFVDPNANIDNVLRNSAKVRGLLTAMFRLVPREAQPWKTLLNLPERVNTLSRAALNPHQDLSQQHSPGLSPEEIDRYNQLTPDQRRQDIANKLASAYKNLLKAASRSIEAYLCRELMDEADTAMKALEPKQQKSGKERRGLTEATVYERAKLYHEMMDWSDAHQTSEEQRLLAILNDPASTQAEIDDASRLLRAIHTFGGLRWATLDKTEQGVNVLLAYISTGRAAWEQRLNAERRETERIRLAIAHLQPEVRPTHVAEEQRRQGFMFANKLGQYMDSHMNMGNTLHMLGQLPGETGRYFTTMRDRYSLALDNKNDAMRRMFETVENALDNILGLKGSKLSRENKRSAQIVRWNQPARTGIRRAGTIRIDRFRFSEADITRIADILINGTKAEFEQAVHEKFLRSNVDESLRLNSLPYKQVWQDAWTQYQDMQNKGTYRGGDIYVDHYGQRDTAHTEELELSPLQAANLVMMADQPSYANQYSAMPDGTIRLVKQGTMDINGYTDPVLSALEQYAGRDLIAWARFLRDTFNHTGLFEAYAEYMGLPFPKEPNYWPGMFDTPQTGALADALDSSRQGNGLHQMLIKRRDHLTAPDPTLDLFDVWKYAMEQHLAYVHLSPITRDVRRLLRDSDTQTRIKDLVGSGAISNILTLLDTADAAPAMSLRASKAANEVWTTALGKQAITLLSGAVTSAAKQASAVGNATAAPGVNLLNLPYYLLKGFTGEGYTNPLSILKTKVFQNRINRETLTRRALSLKPGEKQTALSHMRIWGMRFLEYPDAAFNAIGMSAAWNQRFDELKAAVLATPGHPGKLSPEEIDLIRQDCERHVSQLMHRTAQPMEKEDKGALLQQRNAFLSAFTYMGGETLAKLGLAREQYKAALARTAGQSKPVRAIERWKQARHYLWTVSKFSIANQLLLVGLAILNGSAPEDDDEFEDWLAMNALAGISGVGLLTMVPFIGSGISAIGQKIAGPRGAFATFDSTMGISARDLENIAKAFDSDRSDGERAYAATESLRALGTLTNVVAGRNPALSFTGEVLDGINTVLNIFRPAIQRWKNTDKKKKTKKIAPL